MEINLSLNIHYSLSIETMQKREYLWTTHQPQQTHTRRKTTDILYDETLIEMLQIKHPPKLANQLTQQIKNQLGYAVRQPPQPVLFQSHDLQSIKKAQLKKKDFKFSFPQTEQPSHIVSNIRQVMSRQKEMILERKKELAQAKAHRHIINQAAVQMRCQKKNSQTIERTARHQQRLSQNKRKIQAYKNIAVLQSTIKHKNAQDRRNRRQEAKRHTIERNFKEKIDRQSPVIIHKNEKGNFYFPARTLNLETRQELSEQDRQDDQLMREWMELMKQEGEKQEWRAKLLKTANGYEAKEMAKRFDAEREQFRRQSNVLKKKLQVIKLHMK